MQCISANTYVANVWSIHYYWQNWLSNDDMIIIPSLNVCACMIYRIMEIVYGGKLSRLQHLVEIHG